MLSSGLPRDWRPGSPANSGVPNCSPEVGGKMVKSAFWKSVGSGGWGVNTPCCCWAKDDRSSLPLSWGVKFWKDWSLG